MYVLYVHISPSNKLYIGITKRNVQVRWGVNGEGYDKNTTAIGRAIKKYGWNNFKHIVLLENLTKEEACECEKYLIAKYRTTDYRYGYNITAGGQGISGVTRSEETRHKISLSKKGKKNPDAGKKLSEYLKEHPRKFSEDTRKKMSAAHKGFKHSEEAKQKMRDACVGRIAHKQTDETRAKISRAFKGVNHPLYGKHHSEESKLKISKSKRGRRVITKWEKMGKSHLTKLFDA